MGRVYLQYSDNKWNRVEKSDFWIDERLLDMLEGIKDIQSKGWDAVIIVDGKERSGKSVMGMIMGWYLSNCNLTLDNFARGLGDCAEKIAKLPDKSVIMVDEASTVFASKDSMTEEGKQLGKIMDVVGQKNMIFILCLPCFFDLNKTIAVRRSLFLCNVYADKEYNRGQYSFWGEHGKKLLYLEGKKNHDSYRFPDADWNAEFMDFEPPFYKEYKEIVKKESLREVLSEAMNTNNKQSVSKSVRMAEARFYAYLKDKMNMNINQLKAIKGEASETIYEKIKDFNTFNKEK